MTNLEKVKSLIKLKELEDLLEDESKLVCLFIEDARKLFESKFSISLSGKSTTPKKLYGRLYRELSKEELAEYTQIKRLIKRYNDEK